MKCSFLLTNNFTFINLFINEESKQNLGLGSISEGVPSKLFGPAFLNFSNKSISFNPLEQVGKLSQRKFIFVFRETTDGQCTLLTRTACQVT